MKDDKKPNETTDTNDNVTHNAHYDQNGEPQQFDERDRKDSADDWNAENSRTGRHK